MNSADNGHPREKRSWEIAGADGQPIYIEDGEWYMNTKARARRMMLNSLSPEARQIFACLELACMGFHQELAVKLRKGRKVPLRSFDIQEQTGLSRQNVRRGLAELEAAGLVERRADDAGALRKGHVLIYCFAEPRHVEANFVVSARLQFPDWWPETWTPLTKLFTRHKLFPSIDEESARDYKEEGDEVARSYQQAEIVALRFAERVCARRRSNKEERTERTFERNPSSSSGSEVDSRKDDDTPQPERVERTPKAEPPSIPSPASDGQNTGIKTATANAGGPSGQATATALDPEVAEVISTAQWYGIPMDAPAAADLIAACRHEDPAGATVERIVHEVHQKAPAAKEPKVRLPVAHLRKSVLRMFIGGYREARLAEIEAPPSNPPPPRDEGPPNDYERFREQWQVKRPGECPPSLEEWVERWSGGQKL
jgi:DNA-binding transcriptional ArsR family regulator